MVFKSDLEAENEEQSQNRIPEFGDNGTECAATQSEKPGTRDEEEITAR